MTAKTPSQLLSSFENGDVPVQSDYADVFDSYINVAQTTAQSVASDLNLQNVNAEIVSASAVYITGALEAETVSAGSLNVTNAVQCATVSSQRVNASAGRFLDTVSAEQVFASAGTFGVLCRATDSSVLATGGTQGGAKAMTAEFNRVVAGSAGVRLSQIVGRGQMVWNDTNTNINVYPAAGTNIDDLSTNSPYVVSASLGVGFYYFNGFYMSK